MGTRKNAPARCLCAERPSCGKAALSSISSSLSRCGPLGLALALSQGAPHPLWVHRAHPRHAALRLGAERPWHPQPWVCWSQAPSTPVCSCGSGQAAAARQGPCQGRRWAPLQGAAYPAPGILGAGAISRVSRARSAFCPHLPACSGGATLRPSGNTTPTGCLSPARAWGALTHCASGLVSGRASYVCSVCRRVWEPVCLRLFGCTPVPQAARPLARMPGWAHLSRAAQEADGSRCPVCSIGPAPTCLGSGQGVCREPRGLWQGGLGAAGGHPAGWARCCSGGGPADPAEDVPQSSRLLGEPPCPAQSDALALRVLLPWGHPLAPWAQQLRGPLRAEPLGAPGRPWAWDISAAPRAADVWIAFLFKPTFAVCVSFSPLPALFI